MTYVFEFCFKARKAREGKIQIENARRYSLATLHPITPLDAATSHSFAHHLSSIFQGCPCALCTDPPDIERCLTLFLQSVLRLQNRSNPGTLTGTLKRNP